MAKKRPTKQNRKKPLLQAATICERVITEKDGVITLIRIIDSITVSSDKDELPPGTLVVTTAVIFKSGEALGKRNITLIARDPDSNEICRLKAVMELEGGEKGGIVSAEIPLAIKMTGLYFIDVLLGSELVTKMPLRIVYKKTPQLHAVVKQKTAKRKSRAKKRVLRKKS